MSITPDLRSWQSCTPLEAEFAAQILQHQRTIRDLQDQLNAAEQHEAAQRRQLQELFSETQRAVTSSNYSDAVLLIDKLIAGDTTIEAANFLPRLRDLCLPGKWRRSDFDDAMQSMNYHMVSLRAASIPTTTFAQLEVAWLKLRRALGYKVSL